MFRRPTRGARTAAFLLLAIIWGSPASACGAAATTAATIGPFSPAAIRANAPYQMVSSGFSCTGFTILTLLSANYLKATIASGAVLKLTSTASPTDTVTYRLFADADATSELKPGIDTYYMKGAALNLLNLLGDGTIDVPVHFRLAGATLVPPGTYTGSFAVQWTWNFCNGIAALGLCVGVTDSGTRLSTINVSLVVEPRPPTIAIALGPVTWDAVNGTARPKAIPGSRRRVTVTIANPDIVATEANGIVVVLPTPARMAIALDGDGTGTGAAIQPGDGMPASGLTLTYPAPGSTTDHVDFSIDGGAGWTHQPVAGAATPVVSAVRLRPQGSMAPSSSYSVSIPYGVR